MFHSWSQFSKPFWYVLCCRFVFWVATISHRLGSMLASSYLLLSVWYADWYPTARTLQWMHVLCQLFLFRMVWQGAFRKVHSTSLTSPKKDSKKKQRSATEPISHQLRDHAGRESNVRLRKVISLMNFLQLLSPSLKCYHVSGHSSELSTHLLP